MELAIKCAACIKLGADVAINYKTQDFVEEVKKVTNGKGVDVSRGDSEDFSSINIVDFDEREQVVEYIDGQVYAMAGTTDTHNIIGLNFTFITPAMTETETVYWLAFEPLRSREPKQKRMLV